MPLTWEAINEIVPYGVYLSDDVFTILCNVHIGPEQINLTSSVNVLLTTLLDDLPVFVVTTVFVVGAVVLLFVLVGIKALIPALLFGVAVVIRQAAKPPARKHGYLHAAWQVAAAAALASAYWIILTNCARDEELDERPPACSIEAAIFDQTNRELFCSTRACRDRVRQGS